MRRMVTSSLYAPRHARSESMVTALRKHPTATHMSAHAMAM